MGSALPADLYLRLGPDSSREGGAALIILTCDEEGWPHVAMLSLHELVASREKQVVLAIRSSSRSRANLEDRGRITIALIDEKMTYYVKGEARWLVDAKDLSMTIFRVTIRDVLEDKIPGAKITSGLKFIEEVQAENHELIFERIKKIAAVSSG